MEYRFVGTLCEIGDRKLERLGDKIELSDAEATNAMEGGAQLLTGKQFASVGFTADELRAYARPAQQISAPEPFLAKLKAARAMVGQTDAKEAK